ncbi:MAG: hypothetical protein IT348_01240 [Candidatus Eisenbacteria bacterium]|nr:hypothetical protein [Candidatus Eisenbacteria bacterium]
MAASWRAWENLSKGEQQQITWVVEELRTFAAGRSAISLLPVHDGLDRRREFIADGLFIKAYALLAKPETSGLLPILRRLGCDDLVQPIEQLLRVPVGQVSLIEALCLYRGRMIAHPRFDYDDLQRQFERKGLDDDVAQACFMREMGTLLGALDLLLPQLEKRYAQAADDWRGELVEGMRSEVISADALLADFGKAHSGRVGWGKAVASDKPGVYIVQLREADHAALQPQRELAISLELLTAWLDRVPALRLDRSRPTAAQLRARLARHLWPESRVLYIGSTTRPLRERVREFHRHALGSRHPHRGGQWLKALRPEVLDASEVVWLETAPTISPPDVEEELHRLFAVRLAGHDPLRRRFSAAELLPFANLETVQKIRRHHGLSRVDA